MGAEVRMITIFGIGKQVQRTPTFVDVSDSTVCSLKTIFKQRVLAMIVSRYGNTGLWSRHFVVYVERTQLQT